MVSGKIIKLSDKFEVSIDTAKLDEQLEFLYNIKEGDCYNQCFDSDEKEWLDGLIGMCEGLKAFLEKQK